MVGAIAPPSLPLALVTVPARLGGSGSRRTSSKPISLGTFHRNSRPANAPFASLPTWIVNGGATFWKNGSAWSFDPQLRRHRLEPGADLGGHPFDAVDGPAILDLRQGEELRRGAASRRR